VLQEVVLEIQFSNVETAEDALVQEKNMFNLASVEKAEFLLNELEARANEIMID